MYVCNIFFLVFLFCFPFFFPSNVNMSISELLAFPRPKILKSEKWAQANKRIIVLSHCQKFLERKLLFYSFQNYTDKIERMIT